MSAAALLAELEAAGVRLSLAGNGLRFQTLPGVSIAPYRERITASKPALVAELRQRTTALPEMEWRHVYQDPVVASVPPRDWDGTVCADCRWPEFCRVLGPRGAGLPGGPCTAYRATTAASAPCRSHLRRVEQDEPTYGRARNRR
jgi:hypothetical protein